MHWLEQLDHRLFFWVNNGLSTPLLDYLFRVVSALAHGVALCVMVGVGLWHVDRRVLKQHWGWILLALLSGAVITQSIKYLFDRPRPLDAFAPLLRAGTVHLNVIGHHLNHRSFPSGHTQGAASVLTYLTLLYPRQWVWYGSGLCLVALSRVYLGAHFPSDVLAGAIIGGLCGAMAWRLGIYCKRDASG